ncbi:MAG: hypothetical protein R3279_01235 [Putridiphycobacter sp.]|nr:hypothetical protein [Putridiphycobacter sp.]
MKTNWTKNDLKTYTLIYCANADFTESKVEIDFIKSIIKNANFDQLHKEFELDNDYQSIQKMQAAIQENDYSDAEIDQLIADIKTLFLTDNDYDILEQNMLLGLKRIFKG